MSEFYYKPCKRGGKPYKGVRVLVELFNGGLLTVNTAERMQDLGYQFFMEAGGVVTCIIPPK